jgi:diguanylate cyclase (GGDEF)-like protein/putative nucleotidyltransferase with HDIG domain
MGLPLGCSEGDVLDETVAPLRALGFRRVRVLAWSGFLLVTALYYGAYLLPIPARLALVLNQSAFSLPFALAVVGSLLIAARTGAPERRFWLLLALGNAVLLSAEVYYSAYMILVRLSGPPVPSAFEALNLTGAMLFFILLMSMTRLAGRSPALRIRLAADLLGLMIVSTAAVYSLVVTPLFDAYRVAAPATRVLAAIYPVIGLIMAGGTLTNIVGFKVSKWQPWEKLIALSLGIFSIGLVMWPLSAVTLAPNTTASLSDVLFIAGEYLLFMATVSRLTAESAARLRPMPPPLAFVEPVGRSWAWLLIPLTMLVGVPYFGYRAYAASHDPFSYGMFSFAAATLLVVLVTRTALMALENGRLFHRSVTDPLTGLFNHRYFHERLVTEFELAERYGDRLSVAVVDLDDFSTVNNVRGHVVGDELLGRVSKTIARSCRASDAVCRVGGDEFGLIMPETGPEDAENVCQRVVEALRSESSAADWTLTASVGFASYPDDAKDKDELLRRADGAQYWAKYHGKSRVVRFDADVVDALDAEERIRRLEEGSHLATVRALAAAVDARDPRTQDHSRNVARLAAAFALDLGLDAQKIKLIEAAGLLHDIGKIGISDDVLKKKGSLTAEERAHIEEHPVLGRRILASTSLQEILPWTLSHHERWDGGGYPEGLAGEEIPLEARILAVCDAYDAMTSERPYHRVMDMTEALHEIDLAAGSQFDPTLADAFIVMMKRQAAAG